MPTAQERSTTEAIESMGMPPAGTREFNGRRFRQMMTTTNRKNALTRATELRQRGGRVRISRRPGPGRLRIYTLWVNGTLKKLPRGPIGRKRHM